ncbi:hypothetical protein M438DRAFT_341056 [Aureobasidium pullulans EXF-150]|uniref:Uncharacterized protein n=2 Tax=Aureobasidium pullulans TaxID=5580 RepID=A0A074Y020_AURPU|nr:uncharacterized protein M438DRAFT_341056 [Aureobasidium pullulans EXF-150]KEQ89264.1 hypothetical protein M438DRAFT_341056 [Aureobasidium pullulans EXF-150]THW38736.1 hypothetical protein D6D21_07635 [Aureobasidium pullulans]
MVLEEATNHSEPNSFGELPTPEDGNVSQTPTRYHIKLDQLPRPVNLFMVPVRDDAIVKTILRSCHEAQAVIHRPLRQEEVDAISYHFAKSLRTVSWGPPVGIAGGALAAYRTMGNFRFPGYTPKPESEGGQFNPERFGPVRGQMARYCWHTLRFQLYGAVGFFTGAILFASYATSVNAVETGSDPRMKDYIEALKNRAQRHTGQMQPQGQRNPIMSQEGRMDQQAQRASQKLGMEDAWKRQDVQRKASDYDDMSPTGGAWMDDYKQETQDTGLLTDDQLNARARTEQSNADRAERAEESRVAAQAQSRVDQSRRNNHNSTDDNSMLGASQPAQAPRSSGSTWDRIRQESATSKGSPRQSPTNTPQVKNEQQEGSTLGDSFSFSSSDEERQLAKIEAQKEFDARVERERQGGDFSESGGKGGWRR